MSAIGEKQAEFSGKITSVTIRDTGSEVNVEANVGSFGMVFGTVAFGPAVDAAGETGPVGKRSVRVERLCRSVVGGRGARVGSTDEKSNTSVLTLKDSEFLWWTNLIWRRGPTRARSTRWIRAKHGVDADLARRAVQRRRLSPPCTQQNC